MNEHMSPIPSRLYNAAVGGHVAGADQIIDDETSLTLDKVAGGALEEKEYTSGSDNGMGRVVLRKNLVNGANTLIQSMINKSNTIYVIQYDFTLGEDITVPANCVLEFDGGSISGAYTLIGNNTAVVWDNKTPIFGNGIVIASNGTWNVPYISSKMFVNLSYLNSLKNVVALNNPNIQTTVVIEKENYNYPVSVSNNHESAFKIVSNTEFILNGVIELETNSLQAYNIIAIESSKNVRIKGSGSIVGDYSSHTGSTGEWGHCINVIASENVEISCVNCSQAWGDAIYIGGGLIGTPSNQITIHDCTLHDCRRQGITVGISSKVVIKNNYIYNVSGTAPQAGIDIECDINQQIDNVIIENNTIKSCVRGVCSMSIDNTSIENVIINNNIFVDVNNAISVTNATKNISITNNTIKGTNTNGINISEIDSAYVANNTVGNASGIAFRCVIVDKVIACNNIFKGADIEYYTISGESEFSNNTFEGYFTSLANCPKLIIRNNDIKITGNTGARLYCGILEKNNIHYTNINAQTGARIIQGNNINVIIPSDSVNAIFTTFNDSQFINKNNINIDGQVLIVFNIASKYSDAEHVEISRNNVILNASAHHLTYGSSKMCGEDNVINGTVTNVSAPGESNVISTDTFVYHDKVGTTRPTLNSQEVGVKFFDTTLGKPIYWNGTAWVDATGTPV